MFRKLATFAVVALTMGFASYAAAHDYGPLLKGIGNAHSADRAESRAIEAWKISVRREGRHYYVDWNEARDNNLYCDYDREQNYRIRKRRHRGQIGSGPHVCFAKARPKLRYR